MFLYYTTCCAGTVTPEIQLNMMLCMLGSSTHEYLAIFRVGPATIGFNFDDTTIDIQLLTTNDETIGIPSRFSARLFPDTLFAEMHMLICRMSPLPPVTAIRASHSCVVGGRGSNINYTSNGSSSYHGNSDCIGQLLYFHGFTVADLRENSSVIQEEKIRKFITSESNIFRPDNNDCLTAKTKLTIEQRQRKGWLKMIGIHKLSLIESATFVLFIFGLVAMATTLAAPDPYYYVNWKRISSSIFQCLLQVIYTSAACLIIVTILELIFVWFIKRNSLVEAHLQITSNTNVYTYWLIRLLFLGLLFAAGIGLIIIMLEEIKQNFIGGMFWTGVNILTQVMTIGLWFVLNDCIFELIRRHQAHQNIVKVLADSNLLKESDLLIKSKTSIEPSGLTLVSLSTNATFPVDTRDGPSWNYGPKMTNPNWLEKD